MAIINIKMDTCLHRDFKIYATQNGKCMNEIILEFIRNLVGEGYTHQKPMIRSKPNYSMLKELDEMV